VNERKLLQLSLDAFGQQLFPTEAEAQAFDKEEERLAKEQAQQALRESLLYILHLQGTTLTLSQQEQLASLHDTLELQKLIALAAQGKFRLE
jgi:hypothetical protein